MAATMLEIVQDFTGRLGLPVPTTVFGTTDSQVRQVMKLLEEEGNDLAQRGAWEALVFEGSLTTVATASQGAIATLASNGFRYILNETIWDRTNRLPVCGPLDSSDWQTIQAIYPTGPRFRYRIRGGLLLVTPTPTAGYSWYFEYVSKNWISNAAGNAFYARFTADTNLILLPDDLCLQGLRWRWKKEKGFDYAEDFRTYEDQIKMAMGHDGGKATISMDCDATRGPKPGVFVSPGSWNLP